MLHRFIAVFWLLGVVHMLGAGTDAGQPWFLVLAAVVVRRRWRCSACAGARAWSSAAEARGRDFTFAARLTTVAAWRRPNR